MATQITLLIPKESYEALSEEVRAFAVQRAEHRSWYVNRTSGATWLAIKTTPGCTEEDLAKFRALGFHLV